MYYDVALPNDNEDRLVEIYENFGIKNVVFCYFVKDKEDLKIFKIDNIKYFERINIFYCAIIDNEDIKKTLELAYDLFYSDKLYNDLIIIKAINYEYNSKILNKYQFNFILNPIKRDYKYLFGGIGKNDINKIIKNDLAIIYSIKDIIKRPADIEAIRFFNKKFHKRGISAIAASFASKSIEVPSKLVIRAYHNILNLKVNQNILFNQIKRTRLAKRKDYFTKGYYIAKYPYEDCREF